MGLFKELVTDGLHLMIWSSVWQASQRVQETDPPCIVKTRRLMAANPGAVSLAQGIVHWQPPRSAVESAAKMVLENPSVNSYGTNEGLPELTSALKSKLTEVNNLPDVSWVPMISGLCKKMTLDQVHF